MEQTIVVGFDGSTSSVEALRWAAAEAAARGWDVLVVESWTEPRLSRSPLTGGGHHSTELEDRARSELEEAVDRVRRDVPDVRLRTDLVTGRPAPELIAASQDAGLLVVGARGRGGFSSLLLGSVSQRVATDAASTVVVVRESGDAEGDVVVGVDGSEPSRAALVWAAEVARRRHRKLRVVLAWSYLLPQGEHGAEPFDPDYGEADAWASLRAIVADVLGADPDVDVVADAVCDLPARALVERAAGASLLVVAPRGWSRHGPGAIGSVTLQVLHHAPCPLAIVRPT